MQGWVLLLLGPFHVLPFPNSPFQPRFGLSAFPSLCSSPAVCGWVCSRSSWIFSCWIFSIILLLQSQQGEPQGWHSWQSSPHHPADPETPKIIQLEQPRVSPRHQHITRTQERAEKKRRSRGKSLGEHSWKDRHIWALPRLFPAGITTRDPHIGGDDARLGFGKGRCWRHRGHFPKTRSAAESAAGAGGGSSSPLPAPLPTRSPRKAPEQQEGAAASTNPRGFIHPCSCGNDIIQDFFFWEMGFPKNSCPCVQLHPNSLEGGTGSHPPAQAFSSLQTSARGAEVTQEALTSLTPQKAVFGLSKPQKILLELTSLSRWRAEAWKQEINNKLFDHF
ncbi:PREDICTED: uncharacterized protein LOC101807223 [Ficedula albicollis]|uniref:uncharacterized protein LOC101807223 n=1 Tax=Ficedula albicollis TaxID=59894 RepID=UPI00035A0C2B|nr:PREDICTED: uncharacterized protein LOC101807223 [Ficedula albicollis]XP_005058430.1 PREDICTED: uncharacterized protein LOC101807223 [Ficedula albicollis]XP_016159256.1 PREDICTED: uncharacterized protein LOC101807223 [Ficedula albicollis]